MKSRKVPSTVNVQPEPDSEKILVHFVHVFLLYADTGGQDRPRTPPPIQVDRTVHGQTSSTQDLTGNME